VSPRRMFPLFLGLGMAALLAGCETLPQRPARTAAAVEAQEKGLVGLQKAELQERLGAPQLIRRDGPAEVWQYAADACVLDLFLYEDGQGHRVDYLEMRVQPDAPLPRARCFQRILAARPAGALN